MADFSTHDALFYGEEAMMAFAAIKVTICGAGALGGNLCEHLVRQGFRSLTVIDRDVVEPHNPGNQPYGLREVGVKKVVALSNRIRRDLNIPIIGHPKDLGMGNADWLLRGADLIVDTFDNGPSRRVVKDWCSTTNVPCVHGGMSYEGYSEVVWNEAYRVPEAIRGIDLCEYPLARDLVLFTVVLLSDAVKQYAAYKEKRGYRFTLGDKAVQIL